MNVDRFLADHSGDWQRLEELVRRAERHPGRLSGRELGELVDLYQRVSTQLSIARTRIGDEAVHARLSVLVARAAAVLYGTRPQTWRAVGRFFTGTFPAAVWHSRLFILASAVLFLLPAGALAVWLASSPVALDVAAPEALRAAYVAEDFEQYYTSAPAAQFATEVTVNNIRVSILAFAGGILACLPTVVVLALNGANLGVAAGVFAAAGEQARFWGLILPHGLLELTAVFVAGGAGLRLGWTLVDPGDRPRGEALVEEGRRAVAIVIGLVLVFALAGLIEGFVTGSALPTWARVGIGVLAEVLVVGWTVAYGRAAHQRGLTGALGEDDRAGWSQPPAHSFAVALTSR